VYGDNLSYNKIESGSGIRIVIIQDSSLRTFLTVVCSVFTYVKVAHSFMIFLKSEILFVVFF